MSNNRNLLSTLPNPCSAITQAHVRAAQENDTKTLATLSDHKNNLGIVVSRANTVFNAAFQQLKDADENITDQTLMQQAAPVVLKKTQVVSSENLAESLDPTADVQTFTYTTTTTGEPHTCSLVRHRNGIVSYQDIAGTGTYIEAKDSKAAQQQLQKELTSNDGSLHHLHVRKRNVTIHSYSSRVAQSAPQTPQAQEKKAAGVRPFSFFNAQNFRPLKPFQLPARLNSLPYTPLFLLMKNVSNRNFTIASPHVALCSHPIVDLVRKKLQRR